MTRASAYVADVGITEYHRDHFHVGIIYASPEEPVARCLHLVRIVLEDEPITDGFFPPRMQRFTPPVPQRRVRQIVQLCRRIAMSEAGKAAIPYGLGAAAGCITEDGLFTEQARKEGLTCATFVTNVFNAAMFPLVLPATWLPRLDDRAWGRRLVDGIEADVEEGDASEAFFLCQRALLHSFVRVRPPEVAAAGLAKRGGLPLHFEQAVELAAQVIERLRAPA